MASVAIFSKVPTENIRSIALDTSSRTSMALLRVLCARWFEIEPRLASMPPDLGRMIARVRCRARHRRQRAVHGSRGAGPREGGSGRRMDRDDGAAVRLRVLGRAARALPARPILRRCRRRVIRGLAATADNWPAVVSRQPGEGRARRPLPPRECEVRFRRARNSRAAAVLRARGGGWRASRRRKRRSFDSRAAQCPALGGRSLR